MLVRRAGIAEPGVVAQVDQQVGRRQIAQDIAAERILETDRNAEPVTAHLDRRLRVRAGSQVRVRDTDQTAESLQQPAHRVILTEQDEVPLVVNPRFGAEQHGAVVKAGFVVLADHQPGQNGGVLRRGRLRHRLQHRQLDILGTAGQRGLRPDDQVAVPVVAGLAPVGVEDILPLFVAPLDFLRDIALHHRHVQRLAGRLGPARLLQQPADQRQQQRQPEQAVTARGQAVIKRNREQQTQRPDTVDPDQRCKTGQRRTGLRVTETEPGHAGSEPAFPPFQREPGQRQQPVGPVGQASAQFRPQPQGDGRRQREVDHEQPGQPAGDDRRRLAKYVQAVVDPVDAETEISEPEQPAGDEGPARRRFAAQQPDQQRRQQDRQRP